MMDDEAAKKRKHHTRSRRGCVQCKARHVKCDEKRPHCSQCKKLDLQCAWHKVIELGASGSAQLESPRTSPHEVQSLPERLPPLQISDLQLLHHWTLSTAPTLADSALSHLWQSRLVDIGFSYPFLLHAMLAVAAIHKATIFHDQASLLYRQSLLHMDHTIEVFRSRLEDLDIGMCSPLFATASLIAIHSLASAQVQAPNDPIAAMCDWMHLVRGVRNTLWHNWYRVTTLDIWPLVQAAMINKTPVRSHPEILNLESLVEHDQVDTDIREACLEAVAELHSLLLGLQRCAQEEGASTTAVALSWPAALSPRFIELIAKKQATPLLIVAHYAALLRKYDNSWFTRGWAAMIIHSVDKTIPSHLRDWLKWPRQCLDGNPS